MTEQYAPMVFDRRLAKGIIKGILHDYVKASAKYLLAFSPKTLADELEIGEPLIRPIWILAGSLEIEDRQLELLHTPTTERQLRGPQEEEPDLFKYSVASAPTRSEYREMLPSREAIKVCVKCSGQGELVEDCKYCQGSGRLVCDMCNGKKYREVVCGACNGTGGDPLYGDPHYHACKKCKGEYGLKGFVREPCSACDETGYSKSPCPNCENGKTRRACPECQGVGFLLQRVVLWARNRTLRITPKPLEPEMQLPSSLPETMEHIYTTPPLPLKDLRTHPNPLSPQVWERVTTRLTQQCTSALHKGDDKAYESQVKSVQASVYLGGVVYAQFSYKERFGNIWLALGSKGQPIDYSVTFFPVQFSDFATELLALILSLAVGAIFSWYFGSWFPLLSIGLAGVFLILAFRYLEWRAEFATLLIRGFFSLIVFLGIVGILTVFIQSITKGQLDSQTILALIVLAVMTTFAIAGIQSEQAAKFFGEFINVIFKK